MKVALKIDVDTYRGTREGVPRLLDILARHNAGATFLFSLGPDHTGRAIKRVFRRGFLKKVSRTSVTAHYGFKTLMYGTLLPGPDIGRTCADVMRQVRDRGFEVGIHTWDHIKWQDTVANADAAWTERQMRLAADRFTEIFGEPALVHGAAGWQMNSHAFRIAQRLGFHYGSDTRGTGPFLPIIRGEPIPCPQLPTTLPTLDELIGIDDVTEVNVAEAVLKASENAPAGSHVYTLHAELEGGKLAPAFEAILDGWKARRVELVSMRDLLASLDIHRLPHHEIAYGEIPGRSGTLALQGKEFLA